MDKITKPVVVVRIPFVPEKHRDWLVDYYNQNIPELHFIVVMQVIAEAMFMVMGEQPNRETALKISHGIKTMEGLAA
jgi:hypothetical protein